MSDIKFDIEVTGVQELRQAADSFQRLGKVSSQLSAQYKPLGAQTAKIVAENTKYLRTQKQLAAAVAQGVITQKEATRALEESMRAARERILTDKTLIDQAKKRKKAEEDARKETARLTKAYAPARVAADLYQKKVREITQAQKRNIISEKEARQSLALLTKEYAAFTKGAATGGNQFAKFNVETYKANQRIKRFASTGLQQAGYQVGDFAVQLQGGTNAAVALGQQGSQLLGIFGPAGAIAGAGLAIATAIVAPLLDAKDAADEAGVSIGSLFDRITSRSDSIGKILETSLSSSLESSRQQFLEISELFDKLDRRTLSKKISDKDSGINIVLRELNDLFAKNADIMDKGYEVTSIFGTGRVLSSDDMAKLKEAQKAIITFQADVGIALRAPIEEVAAGLADAFLTLKDMGSTIAGDIAPEFKKFLEDTGLLGQYEKEILDALEAQKKATENRKEGEAEALATAKRNRDEEQRAVDAVTKAYETRYRALTNAIDVNRASIRSENDKRIVLLAQQQVRKGNLDLYITENKLEGNRAAQLRNALRYLFDTELKLLAIAENTKQAKDEAAEFAKQMKKVADAISQIDKFGLSLSDKLARVTASNQALEQGLDGQIAGEITLLKIQRARLTLGLDRDDILAKSTELRQIDNNISAYEKQLKIQNDLKKADKDSKKKKKDIQDTVDALFAQTDQETILLGLTGERAKEEKVFFDLLKANAKADITLGEDKLRAIAKEIAAQQEANEMYKKAIGFVDGISNAFSDFVASGLKDFKSFVGSIKDMFVRLLADMAAAAVRNKILIPITTGFMAGAGNAAAGTAMGQYAAGGAQAGTIGATLAAGASTIGTGLSTGFMTTMYGGGTGAIAGGLSIGGPLGFSTAIGAAIPYLIAAAVVIGLFTKKTKLLDSGLRATIEGFDIAIETFKKTQTSRLFGLLKSSPVTNYEAASADVADPLIKAINDMQHSIVDAAGTLGIGAAAFDNFSYQFKVSLKGLTEEEQLKKVNEEITKMGDAFASLSGHFETMNELLAVAQQRYDLETRLLSLQGNATKLLARQRELETKATHELNQGILTQIYSLEDAYRSVDIAFATVQRSIEARKDTITRSFNEIMETFEGRINAASENVGVSQSVLGSLEGADSARIGMTREIGLEYLRSLGGASRITDQKKLDKALKAISDPSQDLYTNFVDYQRDFADQSNLIADLENKAGQQLSTDEKTLLELQEQAESARTRYEGQIEALDEQLTKAQEQIDVMKGVDLSVKSVEESIADLSQAVLAAISAQKAAEKALSGGGTGGGGDLAGVQSANAAGAKILDQLGQAGFATRESDGAKFQKIVIRGAEQLLDVAKQLGVQTSGLSGAEISQAISNAGNLGVSVDNATRAKEFALGGYHSGGLRMVGERGPELEMTGPSRVMSNNDTRRMLQNPDLVEAVKSMKQEISELRTEQRQLGINNNKYTKRTYDLYRQWDTEGLPAERT